MFLFVCCVLWEFFSVVVVVSLCVWLFFSAFFFVGEIFVCCGFFWCVLLFSWVFFIIFNFLCVFY